MPITSSAKKALRVSNRKRVFNLASKSKVDEPLKKLKKLVAAKNVKEAQALLPTVYKALDKAAKTGYIKKNTASRKKSRIAALIKRSA